MRTYSGSNQAAATLVSEVYLVIEVPRTVGFVHALPVHVTPVSVQFSALEQKLVSSIAPSKVVMPLMARGFDATEVIERLEACGYQGAVWVLSPKLPNRRMVERELRSMVRGIQVEVIELDEVDAIEAAPVLQMQRPN